MGLMNILIGGTINKSKMKYIISESKIDKIIFNMLDEIYPLDKITYSSPIDFDSESFDTPDGECLIEFFMDSNVIFEWVDDCYFDKNQPYTPLLNVINNNDSYKLYLFGDYIEDAFKFWFKERFNYPVNKVILPSELTNH